MALLSLQIVEYLELRHWVEIFRDDAVDIRMIELGAICDRMERFGFRVPTDDDATLARDFRVRDPLEKFEEIQPIVEIVAGNRAGAFELKSRVLYALCNQGLNFPAEFLYAA